MNDSIQRGKCAIVDAIREEPLGYESNHDIERAILASCEHKMEVRVDSRRHWFKFLWKFMWMLMFLFLFGLMLIYNF